MKIWFGKHEMKPGGGVPIAIGAGKYLVAEVDNFDDDLLLNAGTLTLSFPGGISDDIIIPLQGIQRPYVAPATTLDGA
jgi:hypothetical protein